MSNLTVCFNAIAPIMLIMALGYLAKLLTDYIFRRADEKMRGRAA